MSNIDAQIIELLNIGIKPSGIAEILNLPDVSERIEIMEKNSVEIPNYTHQRDKISNQYNTQQDPSRDRDYKEIITLLKDGKTILEIAKLMDKTPSAVNKIISQMSKLGYSAPIISADQEYSPPGRPNSQKLTQAIIEGLKAGMSQSQIARTLGISRQAVSKRISNMVLNGQLLPDINTTNSNTAFKSYLFELTKTRNATPNQLAIIAQYYGIDIAHLSPDLEPTEMER